MTAFQTQMSISVAFRSAAEFPDGAELIVGPRLQRSTHFHFRMASRAFCRGAPRNRMPAGRSSPNRSMEEKVWSNRYRDSAVGPWFRRMYVLAAVRIAIVLNSLTWARELPPP